MTNPTVCRAKDKAKCWKHGDRHGFVANEKIMKIVEMHSEGYLKDIQPHFINMKSLKTLNAPVLAYAIMSHAKTEKQIDEKQVNQAILIASQLHETQTRANRGLHDRTPYIEHPLRNALRSIRYECNNTEQIVGSILHDTVEDSPIEFSERYARIKTGDEKEARENSFAYIRNTFGSRVEKIVRGVSNPIVDTRGWTIEEKNKLYYDHVAESIPDPDVFLVKACDFIDNAGSLHHNVGKGLNPEGIRRRSMKYLPVATLLQERLTSQDNPINIKAAQREKMFNQLEQIKQRLAILAQK